MSAHGTLFCGRGRRRADRNDRAFSLVEMLVVLAIIGILAVLAIPAFNSISRADAITRGGFFVADQIALARQLASAQNRVVEVRFIDLPDSDGVEGFRAVQLFLADEAGQNFEPLDRLQRLPTAVQIADSTTLSPLLEAGGVVGTGTFGGLTGRRYRGIRMLPNGSIDGSVNMQSNFVTILFSASEDGSNLPENFFSVRVNPVTGRVTHYRP